MSVLASMAGRRGRAVGRRPRHLLAVALAVVGLYVGVVPTLWPDPDVSVVAPAITSAREAVPLRVSVRAWHGNVRVLSVRLYADATRSTTLAAPATSVIAAPRGTWPFMGLDRRTVPQTSTLDVQLPLVPATAGSALAPGVVRGTVDVELEFADPHRRGLQLLIGFGTRRETHRVPIEMAVVR